MANYQEEFKEYTKIIQKKTLRDIISQNYSTNDIKLSDLLNCQQNSSGKIKNWLLSVHRICKTPKLDLPQNNYLSSFKLKLMQVCDKLITEIKSGEFKRGKFKKCAFLKKNSKLLPHDIQQLVSEISCFIGETIEEECINLLIPLFINENSILKRKRFSRQLKESLIKYCKDFSNFFGAENSVGEVSNPVDELLEMQSYFEKFDATLPNSDRNKKLLDMESFLMDQISLETDVPTKEIVEVVDFGSVNECDDMDFKDFDVVEEWNEEGPDEDIKFDIDENFSNNLLESFSVFLKETSEKVIRDLKLHEPSLSGSNLLNISNYDSDLREYISDNHSVSNLQKSYQCDLQNKFQMVLKMKTVKRDSQSNSDCEDDLVRHKVMCAKPRPFIKILSLKKPNVYVDQKMIDDSKVQFLESIPLPDNDGSDSGTVKSTPDVEMKPNVASVTEECDCRGEESILESILDFSDVLTDDFDCTESKEVMQDCEDVEVIGSMVDVAVKGDDVVDYCQDERTVIIESEDVVQETNKVDISTDIDHVSTPDPFEDRMKVNYPVESGFNITRNRTNYSIYSPVRRMSDLAVDFQSLEYRNQDVDDDNGDYDVREMYNYQEPRGYYDSQSEYRYNNNNNGNRYVERSSQRLFHNFLRYTTQTNNTRPYFNPLLRYRDDGNYRQNY